MGYLIFLIVMVWVIKIVADQSKAAGNKKFPGSPESYRKEIIKKEETKSVTAGQMLEKIRTETEERMPKAPKPSPENNVRESAAKEKEEDISTTEYLRQKALTDEKEHREEARQEASRLDRKAGGRMAARRYIEGDSIPKEMHIEKCSYCGAENLIADYKRKEEFTCYFCREML